LSERWAVEDIMQYKFVFLILFFWQPKYLFCLDFGHTVTMQTHTKKHAAFHLVSFSSIDLSGGNCLIKLDTSYRLRPDTNLHHSLKFDWKPDSAILCVETALKFYIICNKLPLGMKFEQHIWKPFILVRMLKKLHDYCIKLNLTVYFPSIVDRRFAQLQELIAALLQMPEAIQLLLANCLDKQWIEICKVSADQRTCSWKREQSSAKAICSAVSVDQCKQRV
jgi:hypothetical protein